MLRQLPDGDEATRSDVITASVSESMCDLVIYKMSDCSASAAGGRDIILLCDKVTKGEWWWWSPPPGFTSDQVRGMVTTLR